MRSGILQPDPISHLKEGDVHTYQITPEDYGFQRAAIDAIKGGDAQENAWMHSKYPGRPGGGQKGYGSIECGRGLRGCRTRSRNLKAGIERARDVIDSGKAKNKLEQLIEFTNSIKV